MSVANSDTGGRAVCPGGASIQSWHDNPVWRRFSFRGQPIWMAREGPPPEGKSMYPAEFNDWWKAHAISPGEYYAAWAERLAYLAWLDGRGVKMPESNSVIILEGDQMYPKQFQAWWAKQVGIGDRDFNTQAKERAYRVWADGRDTPSADVPEPVVEDAPTSDSIADPVIEGTPTGAGGDTARAIIAEAACEQAWASLRQYAGERNRCRAALKRIADSAEAPCRLTAIGMREVAREALGCSPEPAPVPDGNDDMSRAHNISEWARIMSERDRYEAALEEMVRLSGTPGFKGIAADTLAREALNPPKPEPTQVSPRDCLEATLRKFAAGSFVGVVDVNTCARDLDQELHYTELVDASRALVEFVYRDLDRLLIEARRPVEAVLSKIDALAPEPKPEPTQDDDDDGRHRCFDGSPFSRMLRALHALQDECLIPSYSHNSPGPFSYDLRNRIAKRLDAALGYCEMSDLQHELYGVLREVSIELAQSDFGFGSASWGKLRKQVSDAMSKVECSGSVENRNVR